MIDGIFADPAVFSFPGKLSKCSLFVLNECFVCLLCYSAHNGDFSRFHNAVGHTTERSPQINRDRQSSLSGDSTGVCGRWHDYNDAGGRRKRLLCGNRRQSWSSRPVNNVYRIKGRQHSTSTKVDLLIFLFCECRVLYTKLEGKCTPIKVSLTHFLFCECQVLSEWWSKFPGRCYHTEAYYCPNLAVVPSFSQPSHVSNPTTPTQCTNPHLLMDFLALYQVYKSKFFLQHARMLLSRKSPSNSKLIRCDRYSIRDTQRPRVRHGKPYTHEGGRYRQTDRRESISKLVSASLQIWLPWKSYSLDGS